MYCKELLSLTRNGKNNAASPTSSIQRHAPGSRFPHEGTKQLALHLRSCRPAPLSLQKHSHPLRHARPCGLSTETSIRAFLWSRTSRGSAWSSDLFCHSWGFFTAINCHHGCLIYFIILNIPLGGAQWATGSSKKRCHFRLHGAISGLLTDGRGQHPAESSPSWPLPLCFIKQSPAKLDTRLETSTALRCTAPCDPLHHYSIR